MKNLFILMAFGFFLLTGCSKEDTADQIEEQTTDVVYVLRQTNENSIWEAVSVTNLDGDSDVDDTANRGNSAHTHGDIAGFSTFSGTQNNGGAHGSAVIHIPNQIHIILETSSVALVGANENEAVYGGVVSEVIFNNIPPPPPPPPCPTFPNCPPPPACSSFDVGSYVYFSVIDNGQGANADPDEYRPFLYPRCTALSNGGASFPWFIFGSVVLDQNPSDHVKVNN